MNDAPATTIAGAIRVGAARLMGGSDAPHKDAQRILAHVLDRPREYLIAHDHQPLTAMQQRTYEKLIALRRQGMPLPYILGIRPFFDRVFRVTPHVLIPRPETETLVEQALRWAHERKAGRATLIDIGTGSGAIAVTLAAHLPESQVYGTDVSAAALVVAQQNGHDLANIRWVQADLLNGLVGPFDCICANMPYIASAELDILEVARFEPLAALDGGPDGLSLIRRLLAQTPCALRRPGLVLLEMGADQGEAVAALARQAFPDDRVTILKDYGQLDRIVQIVCG